MVAKAIKHVRTVIKLQLYAYIVSNKMTINNKSLGYMPVLLKCYHTLRYFTKLLSVIK